MLKFVKITKLFSCEEFLRYLIVLVIIVAAWVPCFAQDIYDPRDGDNGLSMEFLFGYNFLDGPGASDDFFTLSLSANLQISDWALALEFPLMLQSSDFRTPDRAYDEASDFVNFIKYLRFGYKNETDVYFRIGMLHGESAKLGHGSIIADYYSNIDFDSPEKGFQFDWDHKSWGFETILNSLTHTNLIGTRLYVRPFYRTKGESNKNITFGVTFVSDLRAPTKIVKDDEHNPKINSDHNLVCKDEVLNFLGFDVATPLISTNLMKISPYADFVLMLNYGYGFHLGLHQEYNVPILGDVLPIDFYLEYRSHESEYLPVYFDSFYEIEKYSYPLTISPTTKLNFVKNTKHSTGFYGSLKWGIKDLFWVRGSFTYFNNDPLELKSSLFIEAATQSFVEFKFMYAQRSITRFNELLEQNEKAVIYLHTAIPVKIGGSNINFGLRFTRSWRLLESTGKFIPVDDFMPFVSYKISFSGK